ncbi:hypothetical protein N6H13_03225 [Paenibacillus sp. CC-CFT742]|nr:hypothetical protein [Paenibacillus sp. CC-CFT742]WJH29790.1 hypothetical protein N6H13_03225 [Paenibacillus sp. CC-CFT742]
MSNPQQLYAAERRLFQITTIIISTYEKFTTENRFSPAIMISVYPYNAHALRLKKQLETILQRSIANIFLASQSHISFF